MSRTIRLTRLTAEEAAALLSRASKRAILAHDVAAVAQQAGLLSRTSRKLVRPLGSV